ncbi:O-succinylhomoserine sulfhydrylase [Chitinimonas sp. BJB300]|uniref:O-succinylhomoserine sulfhydrylase n=1 Tax=Chitinimonas sp. BJB300 TaxID=1559339 RepID=UPI000C1024C8|nr:O-succinylhomoserine sulfhydrylase [Chitinimonas sp. BJB300]PHV11188.1 O-succinylhomoserine sulfhydrylase [Chitinimonas sp. BJB300]TSJ89026.1 O-succinylhomoserine sulfhydrylase [Chitinimonas sp. BJB300]
MQDEFEYHLETLAVRAGQERSQFGEHAEALYMTSSFVADNAAQAAARFTGAEPGYIYSRFTNPTVTQFQDRLAAMEGAEAAVATASGMSAILSLCMGHLKAGDHILASSGMFGATIQLFNNWLGKFGVSASYVDATNPAAWEMGVKPETRLFYLETPSNPLTEVADIAAISAIAHRHGALMVVDNCFCSPALQQPLKHGADLVIHSATKYIDGQGRVLGGAVVGSKALIEPVYQFLRTAGPTLSAFNAWVLTKGLETLGIRMKAHCENALALAQWLEQQPTVAKVYYPGLPSHPQHALARRQQSGGGGVVSFELRGGKDAAWRLIDSVQLLSRTANLGDVKTTITHPYTTTHGRISPELKATAGIREGLVRISVGLEYIDDIKRDLLRGL